MHEDIWGSEGRTPLILNTGTRSRCVVYLTPMPLSLRGKRLSFPLKRKLGGSRAGLVALKQRKPLAPPRIEAHLFGLPARYTVTTLTELPLSLHSHTLNPFYLLSPWSRVLLEKLTGSAASQEIPRIFGTRRFLTVPTSARHLSLS